MKYLLRYHKLSKYRQIRKYLFQVDGVCKGQIDKKVYDEAKSMQKRVKGMNEDLQKQLEILDSFSLNEDQPG